MNISQRINSISNLFQIAVECIHLHGLRMEQGKVESSCESGDEPLRSTTPGNLPGGYTTCGLSNNTQLHSVS
jgi:hypothetical protein